MENLRIIKEMFEDDREGLEEAVEIFSQTIPSTIDEVNSALMNKNLESVLECVHRLKGTAGYLEFELSLALIKKIEASNGDFQVITVLWSELESILLATVTSIKAL